MDKHDRKILEKLVEKYHGSKRPIVLRPWFNLVLWLAVTFSIFGLLQVDASKPLVIVLSAFIGAAVMLSFMIQNSESTWRVLKPFFHVKAAKDKLEDT